MSDPFGIAGGADAAAQILLGAAVANAPSRSGALRSQMRVQQSAQDGYVRLELFGPLHGRFVIGGTRPHAIDVVNASVLTNGTTFFGPHVQHPGTQPNDFRLPAIKAAQPAVRALGAEFQRTAIQNIKRRLA